MSETNNNKPKITFHHQPDGEKIGDLLKTQVKTAEIIWIASAFLTKGGLKLLSIVSEKCKEIKIICGINGFITDVSALQRYVSDSKIMNGWIYNGDEPIFHPKLYVFHYSKSVMVIMGSANFTGQGIKDNNEIALQYNLNKENTQYKNIKKYFEGIEKKSTIIENFNCSDYDEKRKVHKIRIELDDDTKKLFGDSGIKEYSFNGKIPASFLWQKSNAGFKDIQISKDSSITPEKYFSKQVFPLKNMKIVTDENKKGIKCTIGKEIHNKKPLFKIRVPKGLKYHTTEFNENEAVRYTINLSNKTIHISKLK